ncbi:MAG: hypothetical protein ACLVAW_04420 [Eisenbergiella massiliensis]
MMTLEKDMVTLKTEPRLLLPSIADSEGTSFVGHEFLRPAPSVKSEAPIILYIPLSSATNCAMRSAAGLTGIIFMAGQS